MKIEVTKRSERMKVEVTKRYVDRMTKAVCEEGTVLDYPDERAMELIASGYAAAARKKSGKQTVEAAE